MADHEHTHCRELLGSLSEYVDGTLGEQLCQEIEQHVAECRNCRIVVDTLRKTVYLYHQTTESADVPAGVRERLFRTLDLEDFTR
jgi:anti-sigma factor (TIGR02949 family)